MRIWKECFEQVALNEKKKKRKVFPCEFREVSKEFQNRLEALMF